MKFNSYITYEYLIINMKDYNKNYISIKDITRTVESANEFPNNYLSDSQLKMLDKYRYLLNLSDKLELQSPVQKKNIELLKLRLYDD